MLHDLFFKKKKKCLNNFDVGMRPNSIYHQEAVFNSPLNSISKSVHHFVFLLIKHEAEAASVICHFCFSDFMHHLLICDCVRVISNKKKPESCIIFIKQQSIKLQVKHACCFAVCLKQSHLIVLKNIRMLHVFF